MTKKNPHLKLKALSMFLAENAQIPRKNTRFLRFWVYLVYLNPSISIYFKNFQKVYNISEKRRVLASQKRTKSEEAAGK